MKQSYNFLRASRSITKTGFHFSVIFSLFFSHGFRMAFGSHFGVILGAKINQKLIKKCVHFSIDFLMVFGMVFGDEFCTSKRRSLQPVDKNTPPEESARIDFWKVFGSFWDPFWAPVGHLWHQKINQKNHPKKASKNHRKKVPKLVPGGPQNRDIS